MAIVVQVPKEEYDVMQERLSWLDSLEAAGVDNWNGIDYAYEMHNRGEE